MLEGVQASRDAYQLNVDVYNLEAAWASTLAVNIQVHGI